MNQNRNPFPTVEDANCKPKSGFIFPVPSFCNKNHNSKCIQHYKAINGKEGLHKCPFGFVTNIRTINSRLETITCLNIKGVSERSEIRKNTKEDELLTRLTAPQYEEVMRSFSQVSGLINFAQNAQKEYESNKRSIRSAKSVIDDTLHELRKLNNQLKKQAFLLNKEVEKGKYDFEKITNYSKNVLATSQLVSVRLNAYDFTLNPEIIDSQTKTPTVIYKKFEKAKHCLSLFANEKNIIIVFKGNSKSLDAVFEIFELLPFILLENAIKYSLAGSEIICSFYDDGSRLKGISIQNIGPKPTAKEIEFLTEKGVRSENVVGKIDGTGIGLYIVKLICDFHEYSLKIETKGPSKISNNIEYASFNVIIEK
jgi:signal transduction histidine kinase